MTEEQIEALEGQELRAAVALMLGWSELARGNREWRGLILGTAPSESRRCPVPPYETSVDACLADVVPFLRQAPRGFEVTIATNEEHRDLAYCVVWFTRRLGEEIEVEARVHDADLGIGIARALCRAALLAWIRVAGEGRECVS